MQTKVPINAVGMTLFLYKNLNRNPEQEPMDLPEISFVHIGNHGETITTKANIRTMEVFGLIAKSEPIAIIVETDAGNFYWSYPENREALDWIASRIMDPSYKSISGLEIGTD